MKRRWGIVGSMVSVGGVLILIKILGFVRQMVVATVFGATADTDLVTLSQSFVGNAQYVLTQALLTAMVPHLCAIAGGKAVLRRFFRYGRAQERHPDLRRHRPGAVHLFSTSGQTAGPHLHPRS